MLDHVMPGYAPSLPPPGEQPFDGAFLLAPASRAHGAESDFESDEDAGFRKRVGKFGLLSVCVLGFFEVIGILLWLVGPAVRPTLESLAVPVCVLGLALIARSGKLDPTALRLVDAAVPMGVGLHFGLMLARSEPTMPMELPALFMVTAILFVRAVVVPSSWTRSSWVAALTVLPTALALLGRGGESLSLLPGHMNRMLVAFGLAWLAFLVVVTAYASQTIFGLHRRVRVATQLGQYVLERKLGEGGMGAVFLGRHVLLKRPAAIKVLRRERMGALDRARFEREVQITSSLTHPNTVTVLDYGWTTDGIFYYVMEFLDGVDLEKLVDQHGPMPAWRVVNVLRQACGALAEAHARGLVHRDIKPANMMLSRRGGVPDVLHVLDFGLASPLEHGLTSSAIAGTPGYIAPELVANRSTGDASADLYALGAVAYFLLTGTLVFDGVSPADLTLKHLTNAVEPPSARLGDPLPLEVEELVMECLAKSPEARPPSARALMGRLEEIAERLAFDREGASAFWDQAARAGETAPPRQDPSVFAAPER
jgi:serine/threonine-protein kinase